MKIAIQTCTIDNYGACLQAYALLSSIIKINKSANIISFDRYNFYQPNFKHIIHLFLSSIKHINFKQFNKEYSLYHKHKLFDLFRKKYLEMDLDLYRDIKVIKI